MIRHLILIGLPGAGKTTVGRRAAEMLAAEFSDLDAMVEEEAGRSISGIWSRMGEAAFRQLERLAMDRALARPPHLIAAGAGWVAQPGNLAAAMTRRARVVYLKITPAQAAERVGATGHRPLLAEGDALQRIEQLLAAREVWYAQADRELDAAGDIEAVAAALVTLQRDLDAG